MIGASGDPTRIGGIIVSLLQRYKFPGQVFLVNPKYEEIQGFRCYPSVADIPADAEIDVAIVYLSADQVNDVARACGERGVKGLVVISAGFAEVGGDGVRLQHELTATANSYDMAMCGPNCAGIANFVADFVAYGTTNFIDLEHIKKGNVALLSASGASATPSSPTARNGRSASATSSASATRRSRPPPTTSTCSSTTRTSR